MITAIEIENFKGIGKRQRIELRPITLLFGPNSAGKSTILHALHYAREVLERRNCDADHTTGGGPFVDLGGFRAFVHNHDLNAAVTLAFELRFPESDESLIPQIGQWQAHDGVSGLARERLDRAESVRVEFSIRWSPYLNMAFVSRYQVWIDGESVGVIEADADKAKPRLTRVNTDHPILRGETELDRDVAGSGAGVPDGAGYADGSGFGGGSGSGTGFSDGSGSGRSTPPSRHGPTDAHADEEVDALMRQWNALPLVQTTTDPKPIRAWPLRGFTSALPHFGDELYFEAIQGFEWAEAMDATYTLAAHNLLSCMLVGPGKLLREELENLRYIGPLRETPPRNFEPPLTPSPERWATGLAAWDELKSASDGFVAQVSFWMGGEETLNAGYNLRRERIAELALASPLAIQLLSPHGAADIEDLPQKIATLPQRTRLVLVDKHNPALCVDAEDVGEGVAQIVPIVVAALSSHKSMLVVEQPELHIHPRMQVALGDLFIHRLAHAKFRLANEGDFESRITLIETHSEHLLLRLLRRIAQTTDGELPDGSIGLTPGELAVYYVAPGPDGARIEPLPVDATGEFMVPWPQGFFEERAKELFG